MQINKIANSVNCKIWWTIGTVLVLTLISCDRASTNKYFLEKGFEYADKSDWANALIYFRKATEKEPKNSVAWANLGTAYLNTGKPKLAIECYGEAYSLNPDNPYISCSLSSGYNALKDPKKAINHADNALSINPEYTPAMLNKAKALRALGKKKEAKLLFEKAIKLRPKLQRHWTE